MAKYTSGNTRVLLDLGPLHAPLAAYAIEVDLSLVAVIKLILRDAITDGHTITLPALEGGSTITEVSDFAQEDVQPGMD